MAKYSILTTDSKVYNNEEYISSCLDHGIKFFIFGNKTSLANLKIKFPNHVRARLLQLFPINVKIETLTIEDGVVGKSLEIKLDELALKAPTFNYEQYKIEHADPYNDLIIEAGAGTGKTTVMIDRILFLLHVVPDLSLEDIGMITFTNEATQHMKHKIQDLLMQRYLITKSSKYLHFLEDNSKIQIQTIHSFSKDIINELGASIGYAHSLGLKSFKYEKRQLVHEVLNEIYLKHPSSVEKGLGAKLYDLDTIILNFWEQLENIGLTDEEISKLDWGLAQNKDSEKLHKTLKSSFTQLNLKYNKLKLEKDSIAVGDIVRELRRIIETGTDINLKSKKLKYLFVDEFQDSDNAQIQTIAWLKKSTGLKIFAVGDVKQSIYRFRGAVETAFDKLKKQITSNNELSLDTFTLVRNYRTSSDVLDAIDPIFRKLNDQNLLDYGASLEAQKTYKGICELKNVRKSKWVYEQEIISTLKDLLKDCICHFENDKDIYGDSSSQHVTVLTRTNYQLQYIGKLCRDAHIPCYIRQDGTFYTSPAVRDFYCLVKAFLFSKNITHLFDYINSSYSKIDLDIEVLESYEPGSNDQLNYLLSLLDQQGWEDWKRQFRLRPVLSVLREIVDTNDPTGRFIAKRKQLIDIDTDDDMESISAGLAIEAAQYNADIEKLLEILRKQFSGQMTSLYQIYSFLQINMATNRTEDEPDISSETDYHCVYGMTVHKAKGLEFDTVFLPLTFRSFRQKLATELLLDESYDPPRVGWSKVVTGANQGEISAHKCNSYYMECLEKEFHDVDREEARLLYVALTRAMRRLTCFIIGSNEHNWARMLEV